MRFKNRMPALIIGVIFPIILLSACGNIMMTEAEAETAADKIICAIQENDKETIKGLFSEQALEDCEDIDGGIDYLLNYIEGDIVKYEQDAQNENRRKNDGIVQIDTRTWYHIESSEGKYVLFLMEYQRDDINPANEGVYMAAIYKEEEDTEYKDLGLGYAVLCAGVYVKDSGV